jgi:hypothetical protein
VCFLAHISGQTAHGGPFRHREFCEWRSGKRLGRRWSTANAAARLVSGAVLVVSRALSLPRSAAGSGEHFACFGRTAKAHRCIGDFAPSRSPALGPRGSAARGRPAISSHTLTTICGWRGPFQRPRSRIAMLRASAAVHAYLYVERWRGRQRVPGTCANTRARFRWLLSCVVRGSKQGREWTSQACGSALCGSSSRLSMRQLRQGVGICCQKAPGQGFLFHSCFRREIGLRRAHWRWHPLAITPNTTLRTASQAWGCVRSC